MRKALKKLIETVTLFAVYSFMLHETLRNSFIHNVFHNGNKGGAKMARMFSHNFLFWNECSVSVTWQWVTSLLGILSCCSGLFSKFLSCWLTFLRWVSETICRCNLCLSAHVNRNRRLPVITKPPMKLLEFVVFAVIVSIFRLVSFLSNQALGLHLEICMSG